MHYLMNGSQVEVAPTPKPTTGEPGLFSESGQGGQPSWPGADWFNASIFEFQNALQAQGITFDPTKYDHLSKALRGAAKITALTVSAARDMDELSLGQVIETHHFNADIKQNWLVVESDPAPEFGLKINGSEYYLKEVSNLKFFESFGAFGNGSDLDDDAFTFARSYNGKVLGNPNATYNVSTECDLSNGACWDGQWSKVKLQGNKRFSIVDSYCKLERFDVDGLDEDHSTSPVKINSPSINAEIGDMKYRNFHGKTSTQTYVLTIPMYGASNFKVGNQSFFNILQDDDGVVTGKGFVGGVYFVGVDSQVLSGKSHGRVGDIFGDVVKSIDAGSGEVQDSDLVRFYAETASTEEFDITVGNVYGRNVYKRCVKASSFGGIKFGDIWSFNPQDDDNVYTLHAAVEVLSTGFNFKFGDIYVDGPSQRCIWFKNKGNKCGDIFDGGGGYGVVFGELGSQAISCQAGNVLGRGNESGGSQGIGVRFINADHCQTGNVTGLFAVSLDTDVTNTGANTIGDISCNGRINSSYGSTTVGAINVDIREETVAGAHFTLGRNTKLTSTEIITDGRYTVAVVGDQIDIDLGRMRIVRATSTNGIENGHSVFGSSSAQNGILRGKLEVEVNAAVPGSPSGSSGRTLVYLTGLDIDDFDLSMNITAPSRGATGFNYWLNGVNGQANRIAVKSKMDLVGSQLNGKLGVTKLENLVPGGSTVTCTGEVNVCFIEKEAASNVNGVNNTPMIANSTR